MVALIDPDAAVEPASSEIGSRDKSVGWYMPKLESITEAQRDLLENYSRISPGQVIPHLTRIVSQIPPFPAPSPH